MNIFKRRLEDMTFPLMLVQEPRWHKKIRISPYKRIPESTGFRPQWFNLRRNAEFFIP